MTTNPMFLPAVTPIDALEGVRPTWRLAEEPIYLSVVRDLGAPGSLQGPAPADVVAGEVVECPPTGPIGVVEPDGVMTARPAPRKPASKRAPRGRAAS